MCQSFCQSKEKEDLLSQRIKCRIIRKCKKVSTGINLDSSLPKKFLVELLFIYLHGPLAFLDTRNSLLRTQWALVLAKVCLWARPKLSAVASLESPIPLNPSPPNDFSGQGAEEDRLAQPNSRFIYSALNMENAHRSAVASK